MYKPDCRAVFHSMYPMVMSKYRGEFVFVQCEKEALKQAKRFPNSDLLLVRFFKERYRLERENIDLLKKLRGSFRTVSYFDDSDGADSLHFELLPFLDLYFKSQLIKDVRQFQHRKVGRQSFSDYYSEKYGLDSEGENIREPLKNMEHANKLKVAWNLGVSPYPSSYWLKKIAKRVLPYVNFPLGKLTYPRIFRPRQPKAISVRPSRLVQARFGHGSYSQSIGFQRKLMLDVIAQNPAVYLTGRVSRRKFVEELKSVSAILSPFGWGEICFRDFEAISGSALLIKPDMSHLETWPNIYIDGDTYIAINWDCSDIDSVVTGVLHDLNRYNEIAQNASEKYYDDVIDGLDSRVEYFIDLICKAS